MSRKGKNTSQTTVHLTVFMHTFCHTRIENLLKGPAMPSMRFSKTNWLNFHHQHCSSLITNRFETIIIEDSIAARLNRYQSVWTKYLEPLKTLNCGLGGDRVQNVL